MARIDEVTYEEIGRKLVGLVKAAELAGHQRVKSSADHDVDPGENLAAQFVIDAFTKKVPEINEKWFKG
ncbi:MULTISPECIES: hypothetical protein [unclassified Peribacillus]|uniref:hypothetical protein n=1 Tax=unclassified Peribacillus TaxID=2675266 RepID=UPI00366EABC1